MTNRTKIKIVSVMMAFSLSCSGCSGSEEEEYIPSEQKDAGIDNDQISDASDDTNNLQQPSQEHCDTATDKTQCIALGCAIWAEVTDLTEASGETQESCQGHPRINICLADPRSLGGPATQSVHYRVIDGVEQVILYGTRSSFDGFTRCHQQGEDPLEPTGCKCAKFFQ